MYFPEGLTLASNEQQDGLIIQDGQGHVWVTFHEGANGDCGGWEQEIITATCAALNVTKAWNPELEDEQDIATFLLAFYGEENYHVPVGKE